MLAFLQAENNFFEGKSVEILLAVLLLVVAIACIVFVFVIAKKNNRLVSRYGTFSYRRRDDFAILLGLVLCLLDVMLLLLLVWSKSVNIFIVLYTLASVAIAFCLPRIVLEIVFYCRMKGRVNLIESLHSNSSQSQQQSTDEQQNTDNSQGR